MSDFTFPTLAPPSSTPKKVGWGCVWITERMFNIACLLSYPLETWQRLSWLRRSGAALGSLRCCFCAHLANHSLSPPLFLPSTPQPLTAQSTVVHAGTPTDKDGPSSSQAPKQPVPAIREVRAVWGGRQQQRVNCMGPAGSMPVACGS